MKKLTILTSALLMLSITSINCQKSDKLEGVWKIIYQKLERPDTIIIRSPDMILTILVSVGDTLYDPNPFKNPSYKIFTKTHFSLSGLMGEDEFYGHLGNYSYDGKTYTEIIKYSSALSLMGKSIKFKSGMDGDKWTINGVIEIQGEEWKLMETWQRIE